jgi:hypothetical protein
MRWDTLTLYTSGTAGTIGATGTGTVTGPHDPFLFTQPRALPIFAPRTEPHRMAMGRSVKPAVVPRILFVMHT